MSRDRPVPDTRASALVSSKHVTVDDSVFVEEGSSERVTKPKDKRLDKLRRKRSQFSYSSQSSQYSEGSVDGTYSFSETGERIAAGTVSAPAGGRVGTRVKTGWDAMPEGESEGRTIVEQLEDETTSGRDSRTDGGSDPG